MSLALFDLDNTLIAGDSDHLWGDFLVAEGLVDPDKHKALNEHYYRQYQQGQLDIDEYLSFALGPMAGMTPETLSALQDKFLKKHVEPILLDAAFDLLQAHRVNGDTLIIITATNTLVTQPIADRLGVEHLIGCEAELKDGRYTGSQKACRLLAKVKCSESRLGVPNIKSYSRTPFFTAIHTMTYRYCARWRGQSQSTLTTFSGLRLNNVAGRLFP